MGKFVEWLFGISKWQRILGAFILYLTGIPWLIIGISVSIFEENAPFINLEELNLEGESAYLIAGLCFIFAGIVFLAVAIYATYRYKYEIENRSVEFHRPLVQDRKAFLKVQPYFCVNCKKFSDIMREFCEYCGSESSVRNATKNDFKLYARSKQIEGKKELDKEITPTEVIDKSSESTQIPYVLEGIEKSSKKIISFLRDYPYYCVECENFAKHAVPKSPQVQNTFYYSTLCEYCGSADSLRIATKKDVKNFIRKMR
jgi:hypothetical protein